VRSNRLKRQSQKTNLASLAGNTVLQRFGRQQFNCYDQRAGSDSQWLSAPATFTEDRLMWLVLCSAQDVSALWAYQGLQARGLRPLELVTAEMLPYSLKWDHRLGAAGAGTSITLADGRVIKSDAMRAFSTGSPMCPCNI
jgi:hypothetical protein